jgi:hypothetical protein
MYAILELEVYAEVVVLVTGDAALARANSRGLYGMDSAGHPEEDVDVVDVLLYDMVA